MAERTVPFDVADKLDQVVRSFGSRLRVLEQLAHTSHYSPNDLRETIAEGLHALDEDYDRVRKAAHVTFLHAAGRADELGRED